MKKILLLTVCLFCFATGYSCSGIQLKNSCYIGPNSGFVSNTQNLSNHKTNIIFGYNLNFQTNSYRPVYSIVPPKDYFCDNNNLVIKSFYGQPLPENLCTDFGDNF